MKCPLTVQCICPQKRSNEQVAKQPTPITAGFQVETSLFLTGLGLTHSSAVFENTVQNNVQQHCSEQANFLFSTPSVGFSISSEVK